MRSELQLTEITTVKDGFLDSQIAHRLDSTNKALQCQSQAIRNEISSPVSSQNIFDQGSPPVKALEMASSFGLSTGFNWPLRASESWIQTDRINTEPGKTAGAPEKQNTLRDSQIISDDGKPVDYSLLPAPDAGRAATFCFGSRVAKNLSTTLELLNKHKTAALLPESASSKSMSARSADISLLPQSSLPEKQAPENKDSLAERQSTGILKEQAEKPVTEADVLRASGEARQAVDTFAATRSRHTTALKKLNDYIDTACIWFSGDATAAVNVHKVVANVDSMLAKLENWDQAPSWIREADRVQIMQRNGFDAAAMDRFDEWYQIQNKPFKSGGNPPPDRKLVEIQQHLCRRVTVESVKNWLRMAPDIKESVSPIVQQGFQIMAGGKLPDGRAIPKGSDLIVFEKPSSRGPSGQQKVILPFARDGQHVQRFDDVKIAEGLRKLSAITSGGPQSLPEKDLYGFRLDHDPGRLLAAGKQAGFAILRPGGQYGKNVMFMKFADDVTPDMIPRCLRVDGPGGPGTNTGVLYNLVRNAGREHLETLPDDSAKQ